MISRPNPAGLRIVKDSAPQPVDFSLLLLNLGEGVPMRVRVEERDVDSPQISLGLHEHFEGTGEVVSVPGGVLATVDFSFVWRGRSRSMTGVAVPLLSGPGVVLPRGTLAELA